MVFSAQFHDVFYMAMDNKDIIGFDIAANTYKELFRQKTNELVTCMLEAEADRFVVGEERGWVQLFIQYKHKRTFKSVSALQAPDNKAYTCLCNLSHARSYLCARE